MAVNTEVLEGKWKEMKGEAKMWWDKLTDEDLARVEGQRDKLLGTLQEKYGYSKYRAEQELNRFLNQYEGALERTAEGMPGRIKHTIVQYPMLAMLSALVIGFILAKVLSSGNEYR
jgi:uncharacterized protein YjbJ (UPF0337 family)